jgi:MFS family permease
MVIGWPVAAAVSGRLIPRLGFRPLIRAGLAVTAIAAVALALFARGDTLNDLRLTTLLFGVGMGLSNTALIIAVQTSVDWRERGIATASQMFFRTIGGAVAVGVMGGVLNAALARDPSIPPEAASRLLSPEGARSLDPDLIDRLGGALAGGLGTVFWIIASMAVAGFLVALRFPKLPLGGRG